MIRRKLEFMMSSIHAAISIQYWIALLQFHAFIRGVLWMSHNHRVIMLYYVGTSDDLVHFFAVHDLQYAK